MSILVSLCTIRIEIDKSQAMKSNDDESAVTEGGAAAAAAKIEKTTGNKNSRSLQNHRGQRKPKVIKIESFSNNTNETDNEENQGILPSASRETTPLDEQAAQTEYFDEKGFFSGNPFVEITKGIIHLYKQNERNEITEGLSKTLCLLSVPATLNCHDLLNFVAPCHSTLEHIRIIQDATPNQFMVLLEFRSVEAAMEFYKTYNGAAYNTLEPDSVCHAVWVSAVEWGHDGLPPLGHTELPTCPVCLERMDESVDGVLTILCNHAFHANCLIKWGDSTCPVCRCVQTPELSESSVCMECEGTEALWICLICGHVGCGRYQGGHAASHYRVTNHTYALQLGTNRVWDYAGDNFVHRLLQSKCDGKLVATETPVSGDGDEKIDSIQLEYTYLLTSQLNTQREYYEEKLARLESRLESDSKKTKTKIDSLIHDYTDMDLKLTGIKRDKNSLEKKLSQLNVKLSNCQKELIEEREMNKALQSNQSGWESKYTTLEAKFRKNQAEKEAEIADLKDQVRDLMFYMEAQNVIAKSDLKDEIATSSVSIAPSAETTKKTRRKKK